jgi:hypothetical protein
VQFKKLTVIIGLILNFAQIALVVFTPYLNVKPVVRLLMVALNNLVIIGKVGLLITTVFWQS